MRCYKIAMMEKCRMDWDVVTREFRTKKDAREFLCKSTGKLMNALRDGRVMIIKQTTNNKSNGSK